MKVLHFNTESRTAIVQLTRRNLEALLKKLDHVRDGGVSFCEIFSPTFGDPPGTISVIAVEDREHYEDRPPGAMLDNATGKLY